MFLDSKNQETFFYTISKINLFSFKINTQQVNNQIFSNNLIKFRIANIISTSYLYTEYRTSRSSRTNLYETFWKHRKKESNQVMTPNNHLNLLIQRHKNYLFLTTIKKNAEKFFNGFFGHLKTLIQNNNRLEFFF